MRIFEHLRVSDILTDACNLSVSYTPGYYKKKSHKGGLKMLARGFELRIS